LSGCVRGELGGRGGGGEGVKVTVVVEKETTE
jgi:hypothetical protein